MPRVSVIVPLYNKASFVARCIDSILSQSFTDFELVVVNDGSSDGSEQVVKLYSDSRLQLIDQPNQGPGAARNHGVRASRGEMLAFLDADDAWEPELLLESVSRMDAYGNDLASLTWGFTDYPQAESTERRWRELRLAEGRTRVTAKTSALQVAGMLNCMYCSVMRRPVFERLGGFYANGNSRYGEDSHLWIKLLLNYDAAFHAKPLCRVYRDAAQLSGNLGGMRPIEPFLLDPDDVRQACPAELQPLLRDLLSIRALKTASVCGYFGQWRRAQSLVREFVRPGDWRFPYFFPAMAACTPIGSLLGALTRPLLK